MLGISASMLSGANALAPVIGGAIFQFAGASAPFLAAAATTALLFVAALTTLKPGREDGASATLAHAGATH
jgi:hypothetical protein